MQILKVANVANNPYSGIGRVMHETANHLRAQGHEVELWFSDDLFAGQELPLPAHLILPSLILRRVRRRLATGVRFDIVEIHEPGAFHYCAVRRRDVSLPPCVIMSHGLEATHWALRKEVLGRRVGWKSRISVPLTRLSHIRFALRSCSQVMCLNSEDEGFLRKSLGVRPERISRVQHGVDAKYFQERPLTKGPARRLLYVGSWMPHKGIEMLPPTFARLKEAHPALELSLVGTGVQAAEILPIFPNEVRGAVRVVPHIEEEALSEEYRAHDVFVFPSFLESWGLVLMEAGMSGLPLVTTRAGGPADYLRDGDNALLFPRADVTAFHDAVLRLIEDADLRFRLGRAAQSTMSAYTWAAAAETHERAYLRALKTSAGEPAGLL